MSHRGGTARNRLGALITRDTQRRRGCIEGADGSAWDNSELAEEIGLPDGTGGGDHRIIDHLLEGCAGNPAQRRPVCCAVRGAHRKLPLLWNFRLAHQVAHRPRHQHHFLNALETLRNSLGQHTTQAQHTL